MRRPPRYRRPMMMTAGWVLATPLFALALLGAVGGAPALLGLLLPALRIIGTARLIAGPLPKAAEAPIRH